MPAANTRTRRAGLTRERILRAALALVEREGAEALTMRRLGDELGVEAMSLYNHVPNREAVLDGLGELLMARIEIPEPGSDWTDACRAFAGQLRTLTLHHPQAFRLIGLRPLASPAALRPVERLLQCLVSAGSTPAAALGVYRSVASYARGYALAEVTGFTVDASTAAARRPLRALAAEEFPVLRRSVKELSALTPDQAFASGLEALLAGTRATFPG
ncbi:TetR family transcriptional regulator [Baekduia soli]|uniref:TetR family transcriptional regulator n=1 Tax=Baekduia soli TaxID=496014 RepID=A0A5B8U501_9ACTN|nr:TetR/AcrR family transcriptional regulator C-terminal domain-containing protein [Baekduia soli]QEC48199.1 TetR family transcriptional regulator [Baekduia soli]